MRVREKEVERQKGRDINMPSISSASVLVSKTFLLLLTKIVSGSVSYLFQPPN